MSDIFISYRRECSTSDAYFVHDGLEKRGYDVFLDRELRSGRFDQALERRIDSSKDVLVILNRGCLDRCTNENDWLRAEIARALRSGANVVPILMPGFAWPGQQLPDDIVSFPRQNGVNFSLEHHRDSFDKLVRMLRARPLGFIERVSRTVLGRADPVSTALLGQEDLDRLFKQGIEHWDRLEMIEAKQILERLRRDYPNYRHRDWECTPAQILTQEMPDFRRSILIVTGGCPHAQLNDGPQAGWLKQEIETRGSREKLQTAHVITDTVLQEAALYRKCPQIAIGGPNANSLTAELKDQLKTDTVISNRGALIQHDIDGGSQQVALWGRLHEDTAAAVRLFVSSGLLDRYLKRLWKRNPTLTATYNINPG